jgi:hypothetical protein
MRKNLLFALVMISAPALAQVDPRGATNEWSVHLLVIGSKDYAFEGGGTARNDGGAGFGVSVARNLNNYFSVGVEGTLAEFNYRASVAPGSGNAGPGFDTRGDMESGAMRVHATWNLLARRLTPFLTAAAGVIILDTNLASDPPANACWAYPWYGEVCGAEAPSNTLFRLNYGAGAGLRLDLPRNEGFLRLYVSGEWIEIPEASSPVSYVQVRADFGIRF